MCSINIALDDFLVEEVRPSFADDKALEQWLQQQIEELLLERYASYLEARSSTPPPCQYTEEEAIQRVLKATAEAETGKGCLTLDEFEALVETW
jgi:hypothetical protein